MSGFVAAVLFVEVRDVAQQAGEDAAVDRAVGRRAEGQGGVIGLPEAVEGGRGAEVLPFAQRVEQLGVDVAPRLKTLKVTEPAKRTAGTMVPDIATLVAKLRNEAKVI